MEIFVTHNPNSQLVRTKRKKWTRIASLLRRRSFYR